MQLIFKYVTIPDSFRQDLTDTNRLTNILWESTFSVDYWMCTPDKSITVQCLRWFYIMFKVNRVKLIFNQKRLRFFKIRCPVFLSPWFKSYHSTLFFKTRVCLCNTYKDNLSTSGGKRTRIYYNPGILYLTAFIVETNIFGVILI